MNIHIQRVICGDIRENAYIVAAPDRADCVLIDPGDGAGGLLDAMKGRTLGAILLTHGHFDHIMAIPPLLKATNAPVYIHPEDMEMLDNPALNGYDDLMGPGGFTPVPVDRALPLGDALEVCGLSFQVLHTPGHSKGSVCFYLPDAPDGELFTGDTLFRCGYGRMDLHGGSSEQLSRSLTRLLALPGRTRVWPGHDAPTTIEQERKWYLP